MNQHDSKIPLRIAQLISRHLQSNLSAEEQEALEAWMEQSPSNRLLVREICDPQKQEEALEKMKTYKKQQVLEAILGGNIPASKQTVPKRSYKWYYAAASVLVLSAIALLLYTSRNAIDVDSSVRAAATKPKENAQPTLTLPDGTILRLDAHKSGIVVGNQLRYEDGTVLNDIESSPESRLSLTTPIGEQYQITLPDGTKVWLNAASTLKYPSQFHSKERRVELIGEGYFEVASVRDPRSGKIPFIVESAGQEVEVLGTHFNVNAYADNRTVRTTLLEGRVRVKPTFLKKGQQKAVVIKPGEQSILSSENLEVTHADVEQAMGWKNGDFIFKQESLTDIMQKLERWYGVEVVYSKKVNQQQTFSGKFSMGKPLADVLSALGATEEIKFNVEGKRVTVMQN